MQILELALALFGLCSAIALFVTWLVSRRNASIRATMELFRARLNSQEFVEYFGEATPSHVREMARQYLGEGGGKPELLALGVLVIANLEGLNQKAEHQNDD